MTKIEITDAMVERACKSADLMWSRDMVRTMLDAALNPPPEPEITVTREMSIAGARAYNEYLMLNHQPVKPEEMAFVGGVAAAFRAMRALEPKYISAAHPQGMQGSRLHKRLGDPAYYSHDRKEDRR